MTEIKYKWNQRKNYLSIIMKVFLYRKRSGYCSNSLSYNLYDLHLSVSNVRQSVTWLGWLNYQVKIYDFFFLPGSSVMKTHYSLWLYWFVSIISGSSQFRVFKYLMIRYLDNEAFLDISLFLKKLLYCFLFTNCQSLYRQLENTLYIKTEATKYYIKHIMKNFDKNISLTFIENLFNMVIT